ncbi:MAG: hypothetical protein RL557_1074 [archaeon]|jgi:L-threonylcarbamoyladenylate synthase
MKKEINYLNVLVFMTIRMIYSDITYEILTREILQGKIFIYPTDTIYGLGCNALDEAAVKKIKKIKNRDKKKPLSIITPSFAWIKKNFIVDVDVKKYLPGPYTLILKKKNHSFLQWISESDSIGIRIPNHPFTKKIQKAGVPFVTTSVNKAGEKPLISLSDLSNEIKNKVDIIIDAGMLDGKPSTLIMKGKEIKR